MQARLSQSRYDRRWHTIAAQIPTSDLSIRGLGAHFSFLLSAFSFSPPLLSPHPLGRAKRSEAPSPALRTLI